MKKFIFPVALLALGACSSAHKTDGYFVTAEEAQARGGIGNYVPRTAEVKAEAAKPTASLFNYDTNSSAISSDETAKLDKLVADLKANPDSKVQIEGYADATGTTESNQTLSEARADSVKDYLISQGISEDRIQTQSFGDQRSDRSKRDVGFREDRKVLIFMS